MPVYRVLLTRSVTEEAELYVAADHESQIDSAIYELETRLTSSDWEPVYTDLEGFEIVMETDAESYIDVDLRDPSLMDEEDSEDRAWPV